MDNYNELITAFYENADLTLLNARDTFYNLVLDIFDAGFDPYYIFDDDEKCAAVENYFYGESFRYKDFKTPLDRITCLICDILENRIR